MSLCNTNASLLSIRPPSSTGDCDCECSLDSIRSSIAYLCIGAEAGANMDTILQNINDTICTVQEDIEEIEEEITVVGIDWCAPNATLPPATSTLQETVEFISEELIARSGNNCDDCPITDDLFFTDTKGIYQCTVSQDGGYVIFDGDYTKINADEQTKVESDLWVDAGFSAGLGTTTTDLNLDLVDLGSLKFTYTLDCSGGSRAISLTEIGAGLDNSKRIFAIRRIDCVVANTGTIQAFAGETIEGVSSINIQVGHSYIIHAQNNTTDWKIIAEYYGGCDAIEEQNNGNIYMAYRLGVGTNTATAKTHILNADTTLVTMKLLNSGVAAADMLQVSINGTVKDVVDEVGSVHIGGSNPSARLHVTGIGLNSSTQAFLVEDLNGLDHMWIEDGGVTVIRPAVDHRYTFSDSALSFTSDAGAIRTQTITAERITWNYTLHTTSNVGIAVGDVYWNMIINAIASSGGAGSTSLLRLAPTIALTGTATGDFVGINYVPASVSVQGRHYAAIFASGDIVMGAQSGNASAILQIDSTTKAFLPPRMTGTQRDAISSPAAGSIVYNSTTNKLNVYTGAGWEVITSV